MDINYSNALKVIFLQHKGRRTLACCVLTSCQCKIQNKAFQTMDYISLFFLEMYFKKGNKWTRLLKQWIKCMSKGNNNVIRFSKLVKVKIQTRFSKQWITFLFSFWKCILRKWTSEQCLPNNGLHAWAKVFSFLSGNVF